MSSAPLAPVYGLVLAGGASSRMQRDKAALLYQGQTQLARTVALMRAHLAEVFVSVRADQTHDSLRSPYPLIVDAVPGGGPIVGIRSAMQAHPQAAWLVVACDLPFLSDAVIVNLLTSRTGGIATAYRSSHDNLPEPLCAIWEPAAAAALQTYQDGGGSCPRKFLIRANIALLAPLDEHALDNVNTPDEYRDAVASLP